MAVKQPLIQRINRGDKAAIIQAIVTDGCCIIMNSTDVETLKKVNAEVQPYLDADKPWKVSRPTVTAADLGVRRYPG